MTQPSLAQVVVRSGPRTPAPGGPSWRGKGPGSFGDAEDAVEAAGGAGLLADVLQADFGGLKGIGAEVGQGGELGVDGELGQFGLGFVPEGVEIGGIDLGRFDLVGGEGGVGGEVAGGGEIDAGDFDRMRRRKPGWSMVPPSRSMVPLGGMVACLDSSFIMSGPMV